MTQSGHYNPPSHHDPQHSAAAHYVLPPPTPSHSGHCSDTLSSSLPHDYSGYLVSQHPVSISDFDFEEFLSDNSFLGEIATDKNFPSPQFSLTSDLPYCSASFHFPSSFPDPCLSQVHFSGTPINSLPSLLGSSGLPSVTSLPGLSGHPPPEVVPKPPFSILPGLKPVNQVLSEVRGTSDDALIKLAIALAKQSIFGKEEMERGSLSGRGDLLALDEQKVNYIKEVVRSRVPRSEVDFEASAVWKSCRQSLSKVCQSFRNKK